MNHVLPQHSDAGLLFTHRFFVRFSLSAGFVFAWIFVFKALWIMSGNNVASALFSTGILYALSQTIVFFLTPLSGRVLRMGLRRGLLWGTCFLFAAFFACFFLFIENAPVRVFSVIASFVVLSALYRALYWLPYRLLQNQYLFSRIGFWGESMIALAPLCAGFVVSGSLGGIGLFSIIAGLLLVSILFILFLNESYESFAWGYAETYTMLFSKRERTLLLHSLSDGIQGVSLLLFWPLVIFLILDQSLWLLGVVLSLTLVCTLVARFLIGKWFPHMHSFSQPALSLLTFSSWVFRLSAVSPATIVAADVFSHTTHSPRRVSIDILSFEQAADGGSFVDEYTALREMGMALGRIGGCSILIGCAFFFSPIVALGLPILGGGIAAAGSVYFSRSSAHEF